MSKLLALHNITETKLKGARAWGFPNAKPGHYNG